MPTSFKKFFTSKALAWGIGAMGVVAAAQSESLKNIGYGIATVFYIGAHQGDRAALPLPPPLQIIYAGTSVQKSVPIRKFRDLKPDTKESVSGQSLSSHEVTPLENTGAAIPENVKELILNDLGLQFSTASSIPSGLRRGVSSRQEIKVSGQNCIN